jgi:hypothetical protein
VATAINGRKNLLESLDRELPILSNLKVIPKTLTLANSYSWRASDHQMTLNVANMAAMLGGWLERQKDLQDFSFDFFNGKIELWAANDLRYGLTDVPDPKFLKQDLVKLKDYLPMITSFADSITTLIIDKGNFSYDFDFSEKTLKVDPTLPSEKLTDYLNFVQAQVKFQNEYLPDIPIDMNDILYLPEMNKTDSWKQVESILKPIASKFEQLHKQGKLNKIIVQWTDLLAPKWEMNLHEKNFRVRMVTQTIYKWISPQQIRTCLDNLDETSTEISCQVPRS